LFIRLLIIAGDTKGRQTNYLPRKEKGKGYRRVGVAATTTTAQKKTKVRETRIKEGPPIETK